MSIDRKILLLPGDGIGPEVILEAERSEEFSPVKNKTGVDSLESSQKDLEAKAMNLLKAAEIQIPEGVNIELSAKICSKDDLQSINLPSFEAGKSYYIH